MSSSWGDADPRDLEIHRDEVGGVRTLWAPARGPLRAALSFRVGVADEPIPHRGVTHLVEHLALSTLGQQSYGYNGFVDSWRTVFHCEGDAGEVQAFLASVSNTLRALPAERLAKEQGLLRTESSKRQTGILGLLDLWRFGALPYGRWVYDEFGLTQLTPDEVQAWASQLFVRENAVLWVSGDPTGLELELASGDTWPAPEASELAQPLPGWINSGSDSEVVGTMTGPTGWATGAAEWLFSRRLFQALREDAGISYSVSANRIRLGPDRRELVVAADGLAERSQELTDAFLQQVDAICSQGLSAAELADWKQQNAKPLASDAAPLFLLDAAATEELCDRPVRSAAQLVDELEALTTDDVGTWLCDARTTALIAVPQGCAPASIEWQQLPQWSDRSVTGRAFSSARADDDVVVAGDEGVSLKGSKGEVVTVRWADCVAALHWDDGTRALLGEDGFQVRLQPRDWVDFPELRTSIDGAVPSERVLHMGPVGSDPSPVKQATAVGGTPRTWRLVGILLLVLAGCVAAIPAVRAEPLAIALCALVGVGSAGVAEGLARRAKRVGPQVRYVTPSGTRTWSRESLWIGVASGLASLVIGPAVVLADLDVPPAIFVIAAVIGLRCADELLRRRRKGR